MFTPAVILLLALDFLCAAPVIEEPKTFTPRKKPPKSVQVEVLKPAENCTLRVHKGDQVEISFHIYLFSSEKEVDYTEPHEGYSFRVGYGESIEGLDQGMIGMCLNETRRMTIPSYLAYGTRGAGVLVPPGASIIMDVTLVYLFPMEFDEARFERVQKNKLVWDKRQKDSHYMSKGGPYYYPDYKKQKPRDEEEAEQMRIEEERRRIFEEEMEKRRKEDEEDEKALQEAIKKLKEEGKIKDETPEIKMRLMQRRRKEKKAVIKGIDPVEQARKEIAERRAKQRKEAAEKKEEDESYIARTPTGRHFRALPRMSRLKPLMNPRSRSYERREAEKTEFKKRTRTVNEKREIGRWRKQKWIEENFPIVKTPEQIKAEEEEAQRLREEEAKKAKVASLKDQILKGKSKKDKAAKEEKKSDS